MNVDLVAAEFTGNAVDADQLPQHRLDQLDLFGLRKRSEFRPRLKVLEFQVPVRPIAAAVVLFDQFQQSLVAVRERVFLCNVKPAEDLLEVDLRSRLLLRHVGSYPPTSSVNLRNETRVSAAISISSSRVSTWRSLTRIRIRLFSNASTAFSN